jgi:hypothetical protein
MFDFSVLNFHFLVYLLELLFSDQVLKEVNKEVEV